jgi:hypothetical protein
MKTRLIEISEYALLTFFKNERFPHANKNQDWQKNDHIVFLVDKKLAALAAVMSDPFTTCELHFIHIVNEEERVPITGLLRDTLINEWGKNIQEHITVQKAFSPATSQLFIQIFDEFRNDFQYYFNEIDYLLRDMSEQELKKAKANQEENVLKKLTDKIEIPENTSIHAKTQFMLREIGKIVGCDTWMASNDQNRNYKGDRLGDDCLDDLPPFDIPLEAKKGIALIDTIWFQKDFPVCAFEAEITSSVYSGILRMADLMTVMPSSKLKLYIIAPLERKDKVLKELARPLFQRIGLTDVCKYVSLESLELLFQKIKGLDGFVSSDVLDAIAISPLLECEEYYV